MKFVSKKSGISWFNIMLSVYFCVLIIIFVMVVVVVIIIIITIMIIIMIIYLSLTNHLLIKTTSWLGGERPENRQGNNRGHILSR